MSARSRSNGSQIASYVTALDCALCQRVNRSPDLTAGTFIQLRGASNQRIQCRGDNLLFRDVVDEQPHPGSQRFQRGHDLSEVGRCCRQLLHLSLVDRLDECISCGKVAIQRSGSDARPSGDVVQTGVSAQARKRLLRNLQDALAIPLRIRARLSRRGL